MRATSDISHQDPLSIQPILVSSLVLHPTLSLVVEHNLPGKEEGGGGGVAKAFKRRVETNG